MKREVWWAAVHRFTDWSNRAHLHSCIHFVAYTWNPYTNFLFSNQQDRYKHLRYKYGLFLILYKLFLWIFIVHAVYSVASVMSNSLWPDGLQPTKFLCPWASPGKTTEVGCHALLQGIFPTQGSKLHLLHCRWILDCWAAREAFVWH